jgi:hypothetical protein
MVDNMGDMRPIHGLQQRIIQIRHQSFSIKILGRLTPPRCPIGGTCEPLFGLGDEGGGLAVVLGDVRGRGIEDRNQIKDRNHRPGELKQLIGRVAFFPLVALVGVGVKGCGDHGSLTEGEVGAAVCVWWVGNLSYGRWCCCCCGSSTGRGTLPTKIDTDMLRVVLIVSGTQERRVGIVGVVAAGHLWVCA